MAEEVQEKKYTEIDENAGLGVSAGNGGGDFEEYVMLPADEALKAHVVDVKLGEKTKYKSTEVEERMYFWFELDEEDGKGQRYRWDCRPTLTQGKGKKASNFDELMMKLVGKYPAPGEFSKKDIIGLPIRVELTEPKEYSGRSMQFVSTFKKPNADQQKVTVEATQDVVLKDIPDEITTENLDELFD